MTKRTKIFLIVVMGVMGLYGLRLITYQPPLECGLYDAGFLDEFDDLESPKTSKFETVGTISGIEISVEGHIRGFGLLTIGYTDSTSYRDYQLDSGAININYISDWYSNICYVTFTPTNAPSGQLRVNCNFIGD